MSHHCNLFDAIASHGNDEGYRPRVTQEFQPTNARAGSPEKIAVLRWRMERGLPLWHRDDPCDFWLTDDELPEGHDLADNPRW
jgi:hypothetical protein